MNYFKHSSAIVESDNIGKGTSIGPNSYLHSDVVVGKEALICENVVIEDNVAIGDRVTIKGGVIISEKITVEDDVFIGPNVVFAVGTYSGDEKSGVELSQTRVQKRASIGANATIYSGIVIGKKSMVRPGSVVTHSVPPNAIVSGNPARIEGYVSTPTREVTILNELVPGNKAVQDVGISGVKIYKMPVIEDLRGNLTFYQYGDQLPFIPKRYFIVYDVPTSKVRGEHAHKKLEQILVCIKGSCSVVVDDGNKRLEIPLDNPGVGLYVPPMVWAIQYKYTGDAILMVLASQVYDPDDYIRDYDEFILELEKQSDFKRIER